MKAPRRYNCRDCRRPAGAETGHYYTATEEAWTAAGGTQRIILCLDCFEARLGRPLIESDFVALPHEIIERFAGRSGKRETPAKRQRKLEIWRASVGAR